MTSTDTEEAELLTVDALARFLGITASSVYARRARRPDLLPPALVLGKRPFWRKATVLHWLADLEEAEMQRQADAAAGTL